MRYYDEYDAKQLAAKPWQIALLKANPSYCSWGPHEDYMISKGEGWNSSQTFSTWDEFGPWKLDDLNVCANFYFEIDRAHEQCPTCGGTGYHPDAQWIAESFYSHSSPFKSETYQEARASAIMRSFGPGPGRTLGYDCYPTEDVLAKYGEGFRAFCERMRTRKYWNDDITGDELQALMTARRAESGSSVDDVNRSQRAGRGLDQHDAINRSILIEARCDRLGVPKSCTDCGAHGIVYTAPEAHVSLVLWWLHPRKGCSRGIEIERIEPNDLPAIQEFLRHAAEQNADRFSGLDEIAAEVERSAE